MPRCITPPNHDAERGEKVAATLILVLVVMVLVVPAVIVLAIGRVNEDRRRARIQTTGTEEELPELLRRPLRAGRAS
jgi:hypothetical protein